MVDLSTATLSSSSSNSQTVAASASFKLPGLTGPLWGMHMKVRERLALA
jgi:hypothetical protein